MVPNLVKGAGIKGAALYALHDERTADALAAANHDDPFGGAYKESLQTAERVGFTTTRNLSTDDPHLAWRLMCATAKKQDALKMAAGIGLGGRKTEKFCGHLTLSFDPGDNPDQTTMMKAADGALTALGWEKLQALIVEHRDKEHPHIHIVVNLIDPETGRAAPNRKNDYELLQRWAYAWEQEQGRIVCDRRAERMEAEERGTAPPPRRRWLSHAEWEMAEKQSAKNKTRDRASSRDDRLASQKAQLRETLAAVREGFRSEWAALYQAQRRELKALTKHHASLSDALDRSLRSVAARTRFFNEHRDVMWLGLGNRELGSNAQAINPHIMREALAKAHALQKEALQDVHKEARSDLAARVDAARHDAERAFWKRPATEPTKPVNDQKPDAATPTARVRAPDTYKELREAPSPAPEPTLTPLAARFRRAQETRRRLRDDHARARLRSTPPDREPER